MSKVTAFFINRPRVTHLAVFLIVLMGIICVNSLRRQGYPPIDFDIMKIETTYPGASPEDVEINVTDPIEDELIEVEDIEKIQSLSMENLSMIFVYIDAGASDTRKVKNDIRAAVDRVSDLPSQVTEKPWVDEIRSTNLPVMEVALTGDVPESELRQYAHDLEIELKDTTGVGKIEKVGYRKREVHIEADHQKLEELYVSLGEIMDAIRSRNIRTTGGSLESYVSEKKIVTFSEYQKPLEVADVIIRSTFTGQRLRISDIAEVKEGFEKHEEIAHANGRPGISLVIRSQENADIITLSDDVQTRLERFQKGLPANVEAVILFDNSVYTRSLLDMTVTNGLIGFILVLLMMFLFLDLKSAFWTAFGIPTAMCAAFILFSPFGITINVISLSAMILVLGILVDDAIVIAENIHSYKEKGMEPIPATLAAVKNVFWPVTAAVLTTILAFLPMLYMKGLTGKFVVSIPIVVVLMLVFSLIESTTILPGHIARSTPPKTPPRRTRWIQPLIAKYKQIILWCLAHRKTVLASFAVYAGIVILISSSFLKVILFPQHDPDIFNVIIEAPQGTPLKETEAKISEVEAAIDEMIPQETMQSYITRVGHHDTDVYGGSAGRYDNWGLITVYLKPADERDIRSEPLMEQLRGRLENIKGFERLTVEPMDDGPPVGKPITVIFTSDNDSLRDQFEQETIKFLKGIDGVFAIESTNISGKDELRLLLDYELMAQLGITAMDVSRTVRAAFDGEVVTSIRREGEEIDFRVNLLNPKQYRAQGVLKLLVTNNTGKLVPLAHFAHFKETVGPAVVHHYDGNRSVTITAEVDTEKITSFEANQLLRERFEPKVLKHAGFKMELGGEEKKTQESFQSFYVALAIALLAIYCLLIILFNSFTQPLLIMSAIPLALIGVFLTLLIHNLPLGFIAMIGIVGLVGVVVNDTIVMVSRLNEMTADGDNTLTAITEGATSRFRPVILTTLTTAAGLLPTGYGIGGDLPFIRPMVLALAWGLVFATVISLILIPILYSYHARAKA